MIDSNRKKLIMLVIYLLAGCMLIVPYSLANSTLPPVFNWVKMVPADLYGNIKIIQMKDGNAIAIDDMNAAKFDISANKVWEKHLSNNPFSGFSIRDVVLTSDGGCIFLAVISSQENKAYLIKLDSAGNRIWDKTLSDSKIKDKQIELTNLRQTEDGGFILAGTGKLENEVHLLKTNSQGKLQWSYAYKKDKVPEITGLLKSSDGGYIIIGNTLTEFRKPSGQDAWIVNSYRDGFVLKVDKTGHKKWESVLDESHHTSANSVHETEDRGLLIGGGYADTDEKSQAFLLQLNQDGTTKWKKTFPSEESIKITYIKKATDDGYLILAGPVVIKVNQNGEKEWAKSTFGNNKSIIETPDGYLVVGVDSKPPGDYYFTSHKLSKDTIAILQRKYAELGDEAKVGYVLNFYEVQISRLQQYVEKFKRVKMTAKDKTGIDQELSMFEKTASNMQHDSELAGTYSILVEYLYFSQSLSSRYYDLKLQYNILAETQVNKHIYIPDELQKRCGNKNKISGLNMDGIIVAKVDSFYNLDLRNVTKFTIADNRIDILTKNKHYFLFTDKAEKFSTYAGLGIRTGNFRYVFNTAKFKKPVASEWILIDDVIRYLMDQPKKNSLKYKDLEINKQKGGIYNIKISRVLNGSNTQYFMPNGNCLAVTTKLPAVTYFINTANSTGMTYNDSNTLLKFKDRTYKITVLK